jgi:hypothetical protein
MRTGRPPKLSGERLMEALRMYAADLPAHTIGSKFGLSPAAVLRALRKAGATIRTQADRQRGLPWSKDRRAKTAPAQRRRTKAEWMASNIGRKGITSHGYVRVNVGHGKRQYEHILIAEKALGRKLRAGERVHHVYCDPQDNANLLVCAHDYHLALHARMRDHPYWKQFNP